MNDPMNAPGALGSPPEVLEELRAARSPAELVGKSVALSHPGLALATAFGRESIVIIALLAEIRPDVRVFAIDTGRLNEETFEVAERVRERFGVAIEWHFPDRLLVEALERKEGLYSFRRSLEAPL